MNKIDTARKVMEHAHRGQTRRGGDPYEVHPIAVVDTLGAMGVKDEHIIIAGYLHDVLEDTDFPESEIEETFGKQVLDLVKELTFDEPDDKEIVQDRYYWKRCREMSVDAKVIKVADIIANLGDKGEKTEHFIKKRLVALTFLMRGILGNE